MLTRLAADAVVLAHLAFIAFALGGGLLVWRWPRLAWLHGPALIWAVAVQWLGLICPLTPLENVMRRAAGWGLRRRKRGAGGWALPRAWSARHCAPTTAAAGPSSPT